MIHFISHEMYVLLTILHYVLQFYINNEKKSRYLNKIQLITYRTLHIPKRSNRRFRRARNN